MSIHIGNLYSTINWWTLPAAIPYVIEGWSSPLARHCRERVSRACVSHLMLHRALQVLAVLLIAAFILPLHAATLAVPRPLAQFSSGVEGAGHMVQRKGDVTSVDQIVAELSARMSGDALALFVERHGTLRYVVSQLK